MAQKHGKVIKKLLEVFLQLIFIDEIENASEIVSREDESYICSCSVDSSFGHDVRKVPLSFDNSVRMFNNGLTLSIYFWILCYSPFVLFDHFSVF